MNEYRDMLLEKKKDVLAGLGVSLGKSTRSGPVNEDDQAQILNEEFVSVRLNSLDHARLRMIEAALDRLETGDYGICSACEEPIPDRRLQAIPWAKYCVPCQEQVAAQNAA